MQLQFNSELLKPSPLCYQMEDWDWYNWQEYLEGSPEAQKMLQQGQEKIYSFGSFASEVFHRLYSPRPKRIEKPRPEAAWAVKAHGLLSDAERFPDFLALEERCNGDRLLSGIGTNIFCQKVLEYLPQADFKDPQQFREQFKGQKSFAEQARADLSQQLQQLQQQGKEAVAAAQQYAQQLEENQLIGTFTIACDAAEKAIDQVEGFLMAYGWGDGPGGLSSGGSIEEKLAATQKILSSRKLQQIALQAGRMRVMAAKKQRSKSKQSNLQPVGIETGDNLKRLLPSQMAMLADPNQQVLFVKGMMEKSLLQYEFGGKQKQGQGPIVICIDNSSSMSGNPEIWAKAVALAIAMIAGNQKRHLRVIHYDTFVRRVDDFAPAENNQAKLLDSMDVFFGGGTNWERPFDKALEIIDTETALKKADIIMITDGVCRVRADWLERFKEAQKRKQFTVYGVLIGYSKSDALLQIADRAICIPTLSQDAAIEQVFEI